MKILALDLKAYGPFTDCHLDLSGGQQGLHLIHGPNEAGKSSTLRALSSWLFGIHPQTPDDFLHDYKFLRVGGTLQGTDGRTLTCTRVKKKEKTLLAPDGSVVPDEELSRLLGRLSQSSFETQFRIGHDELRAGGRLMTQANGDVNQSLFAAGAGLAGLRKVGDEINRQMDELFKQRGKKAINLALSDLEDAVSKRKAAEIPPASWTEEDRRRERITAELGRIDLERSKLGRERDDLDRTRRILPLVDQIVEYRGRLAPLAGARLLSDGFTTHRTRAQAARDAAIKSRTQLIEELQRIQAGLDEISVPAPLIAESARLEQVAADRAGYSKAMRSLATLAISLRSKEESANEQLEALRSDLTLDSTDALKVSPDQRANINRLARERSALVKSKAEADARVRSLRATTTALDPDVARRRCDGLDSGLKRWRLQVASESAILTELAEAEALEKTAAIALHRLTRWTGGLSELENLAVPLSEAIDAANEAVESATRLSTELDREHERLATELRQFEAQLKALRLAGDVPSESDLQIARTQRTSAWMSIREHFLSDVLPGHASGVPPASERGANFDRAATQLDRTALVAAFDQAVLLADDLADRLRREAERVSTAAALEVNRSEKANEVAANERRRLDAGVRLQNAISAWNLLWKPIGVEPGTAKEMRAWIKARDEVLRLHDAASVKQRAVATLRRQRDEARGEVLRWLRELDQPDPPTTESLATLVEALESTKARLARSIELAEAQQAAAFADQQLDAWRSEWSLALAPIRASAETLPEVVDDYLKRVDLVFSVLDEIKRYREEISRLGAETDAYERTVRDLTRSLALGDPAGPIETQVQVMLSAYDTARDHQALGVERREKLAETETKLAEWTAILAEAEQRLAAFRLEAGLPTDSEDFEEVERAASEHKRLSDALALEERRLVELAAGKPIALVIEEAVQVDRAELGRQIEAIDARIAPIEAERDRLNQELGACVQVLSQMDGGSSAADHEQRIQTILARISGDAERFAQLKISKALLDRAMQRYREKNEGKVLRRAGEIFERLTLGSFKALALDETEKGGTRIVGVRPSGQSIDPEHMSDGTADALYLSLRIATLEVEFDAHGPVPFVVDDILINLDNARTVAALQVLATLSLKTQVLLFTHHEHLVDLASLHLDRSSTLFVHELRRAEG